MNIHIRTQAAPDHEAIRHVHDLAFGRDEEARLAPFEKVPQIRPARNGDQAEWLRLRALLWPDGSAGEHADELAAFFDTHSSCWSKPFLPVAVFVAVRPAGGLCGCLEASIRPYVEDCETWPVGYVEGWYVDADLRRQGIGRRLVTAAEQWAVAQGCREMASDAHPENKASLDAHKALGFEESSRAVHLRKWLTGANGTAAERRCTTRQRTRIVLEGGRPVDRHCPADRAGTPEAAAPEGEDVVRRLNAEASGALRLDEFAEAGDVQGM